MPFIKRNDQGEIVAFSQVDAPGYVDEAVRKKELSNFLDICTGSDFTIEETDLGFVRVLEDLIELMIEKGLILFTELPASAQDKVMQRQQLRNERAGKLDLIGEDDIL